ncbi:MAG TPA: GDSL-type esterase/lipase family protein [Actinomycetes bacterium]|jgi:lysophospholipase L1-like esterase|nr:GDSL-type esterase/lipase family protein [Actinomycetes bacterium]
MRRAVSVIAVTVVAVALLAAPARAATPPLPSSMASLGDSITRAFDVCCYYGDHPANSWATGGSGLDSIQSHYERLRALNPAITGRQFNDAVTGAKMSDGPRQAGVAVTQGTQYVTILLGANDLCTSSAATMTSAATFRQQFETTMSTLDPDRRGVHVFVSSIPNVLQLWTVLHTNAVARFVWSLARICQSLLASSNGDAERQAVADRERQLNGVLGDVCATYANCRFDQLATFNFQFSAGDVSILDYFHPDLDGQRKLAATTWAASWWATAGV